MATYLALLLDSSLALFLDELLWWGFVDFEDGVSAGMASAVNARLARRNSSMIYSCFGKTLVSTVHCLDIIGL